MLLELIFTVLLHNITNARKHERTTSWVLTPWAPVGAEKRIFCFIMSITKYPQVICTMICVVNINILYEWIQNTLDETFCISWNLSHKKYWIFYSETSAFILYFLSGNIISIYILRNRHIRLNLHPSFTNLCICLVKIFLLLEYSPHFFLSFFRLYLIPFFSSSQTRSSPYLR